MTSLWSSASVALSSRWVRLCVGVGLLALLFHWVDFGQSLAVIAAARLDVLALLPLVLLVDRLIAGQQRRTSRAGGPARPAPEGAAGVGQAGGPV